MSRCDESRQNTRTMYATIIFGLFISVVGKKKKRQTNSATNEGVILRVPFPKKNSSFWTIWKTSKLRYTFKTSAAVCDFFSLSKFWIKGVYSTFFFPESPGNKLLHALGDPSMLQSLLNRSLAPRPNRFPSSSNSARKRNFVAGLVNNTTT